MTNIIAFISLLIYVTTFLEVGECGTFTLKGTFAPVFTPIDEEGEINYDIVKEYAAYLKGNGINGVLAVVGAPLFIDQPNPKTAWQGTWLPFFQGKKDIDRPAQRGVLSLCCTKPAFDSSNLGGTSGEGPNLSECELKKLMTTWIDASKPFGLYVMVQVGGRSEKGMLELAAYAEEKNADAILMLPTIYYRPATILQLVQLIEAVYLAAPNKPILFYHNPKYSNVNFDMVQLFKAASKKVPHFKGMKCALDVASKIKGGVAMKRDQRIFVSDDSLIGSAAFLGFDSFITTGLNIFPQLITDIIESAASGNSKKTTRKQMKLNKLMYIIRRSGTSFVASSKEAMRLVTGLEIGSPRLPLQPLSQKKWNKMKSGFMKQGIELKFEKLV